MSRFTVVSVLAALFAVGCSKNHPPVIASVTASPSAVAPGGTVSITASVSDPDGDALTYSWGIPTGWSPVGDTSSAAVVLTAPSTAGQSAVVTLTVTDDNKGTAFSQVLVSTLNAAALAPTFSSLSATPNPAAPSGQVSLVANATSPVGAALSYSWTSSDPAWTLSGTGGSATLTAPSKYAATTVVEVTANDGNGNQATARIVVATEAYAAPTIASLNATPKVVAPGGAVALSASASDPAGLNLSYTWSVSDPAWTLAGSGASVTLTAPAGYAKSAVVTVTVADDAGGSISQSVTVSTTPGQAPVISGLTASPSDATVGQLTTLSAAVSAPGLTYAWRIASAPAGSTAALSDATAAAPTFTPDVAGNYEVHLVVTDPATGLSSDDASTTLSFDYPAPVAKIAESSPISGAINTPIALDGSGSSDVSGGTLAYEWTVSTSPTNAEFGFFDPNNTTCEGPCDGSQVAKPEFLADTPGTYVVKLTVTDPDHEISTFTTATIVLAGPATITITSGDAQTLKADTDAAQPIVVSVTSATGAPIPGVGLSAWTGSGSINTGTGATDANGKASLLLHAGRIAGAQKYWIALNDLPSIKASGTFTVTAGDAAAIAVGSGVGTADTGTNVTVQVVDAFGNPVTGSYADAQAFTLAASGNAVFDYPDGGSGNTYSGQLTGGSFTIPLTDTTAQNVSVSISSTPNTASSGLPWAAWTTWYDGAEQVPGSFSSSAGNWPEFTQVNGTGKAATGEQSYGLELTPAEVAASGYSRLYNHLGTGSYQLVKLDFDQQITLASANDAQDNCTAQSSFWVSTGYYDYGGSEWGQPITPPEGYATQQNCNGYPSFGTTQGFSHESIDLTSAWDSSPAYQGVSFNAIYGQSTAAPDQATSWYVDNITLTALRIGSSTANAIIKPGAAKKIAFTQSDFSAGNVLYNTCTTGQQGITVNAQLVDQYGNLVEDNVSTYEFDWDGSAVFQGSGNKIVTLASNSVQLTLQNGAASFKVSDANASEVVNFTIANPNVYPGIDSSSTATGQDMDYVCHSTPFGYNGNYRASWSDTTPSATYTQAEAQEACEAVRVYTETGNVCGTDSNIPNAVVITDPYTSYEIAWAYGSGNDASESETLYHDTPTPCSPYIYYLPYSAGQVFQTTDYYFSWFGYDYSCAYYYDGYYSSGTFSASYPYLQSTWN